MSEVSGWILAIVGIVVLSILVDLILPSTNTSKFIKNIFGYIIIIVILSPVFSFFSQKNFSINDIFSGKNVEIQQDFVASVNRQFLSGVEKSIEQSCSDEGIKFVEVGIESDIFENNLKIRKINVNLKGVVIDKNSSHTNIKTAITAIILQNIKVEKEIIVFYE